MTQSKCFISTVWAYFRYNVLYSSDSWLISIQTSLLVQHHFPRTVRFCFTLASNISSSNIKTLRTSLGVYFSDPPDLLVISLLKTGKQFKKKFRWKKELINTRKKEYKNVHSKPQTFYLYSHHHLFTIRYTRRFDGNTRTVTWRT